MLYAARHRALTRGLVFDLTPDDVVIPEVCPVLGVPLVLRYTRPVRKVGGYRDSPALDRIDNNHGYLPGNVWVISHRANRLKLDASLKELRMMIDALIRAREASSLQGPYVQAASKPVLPQNKHWKKASNPQERFVRNMLNMARFRARQRGVAFDLTPDAVSVPDRCPVLGIPLIPVYTRLNGGVQGMPDAPSLDRIDSLKGYTKDNVWVISNRANKLKGDGTLEEFKKLFDALLVLGAK